MKKKNVLGLLIVLISLLYLPSSVNAETTEDIKAAQNVATSTEGIIRKDNNGNYDIEINGKRYDAYCIDRGMKPGTNQAATCASLGNSSFGQAFKRLLSTAKGTAEDKTAMRFLGIITGYSRIPTAKNYRGSQLREQLMSEIGGEITNNHNAYIRALEALFGYNAEDGSISDEKAQQLEDEGATAGALKFGEPQISGQQVTIQVTSASKISKVTFAAQSGTLVSQSWNGTSGVVVLNDDQKKCNVAVKASYNGSDAMLCSREGSQSFIVDTSSDEGVAAVADTGEDTGDATTVTYGVSADKFKKAGVDYCEEDQECTEEVQTPAPILENCCERGGKVDVTEPELNDLFCPHKTLGVEYFVRKKGSDKYIKREPFKFSAKGVVNDRAKMYCNVYCTQRAYIEIPDGIDKVKNGLYFELTKGGWGTASAFEQGTKRCRVRIDYDAWWSRYETWLKKQIDNYNDFEENTAIYRYIDDNSDCSHNSHDKRGDDEVCGEPNKQDAEEYFVECVAHATKASSSCKDAQGKTLTCTVTKEPVVSEVKPIPKQNIAYVFADLQHQEDYYYYKIEWDKEKYDKFERVEVDKKKDNKIQADSKYNYRSIGPLFVKELIDKREEAYGQYAGKDVPSKEIESGDCGTCSKPSPPNPKWECQKSHQVIEDYAATDWVDDGSPWEVRKKEYKAKAQKAAKEFENAEKEARYMEMALDACSSYFSAEPKSYALQEVVDPNNNGLKTEKNYKLKSTYAFDYTQIYLDPYGNLQEFVTDVPFDGGCYIVNEEAETTEGGPLGDHGRTDIWPSYYSKLKYSKYAKDEYYDDFYYGTGDTPISWKVSDEDDTFYKGKQEKTFYDKFLHKHNGEIKGGIFKNDKKFTLDGRYRMECKWDETGADLNTFVPSGSAVPIEQEENITFHGKVYSVFLSTLKGTYDTNHHIGCIGEYCVFDDVVEKGLACAKSNGGGDKISSESVGESAMSCTLEISYSIVLTGKCNPSDVTARIETCEIYGQDANLFEFKVADPSDILPGYEGLDYADNWKDEHGRKAYNQIKADANADKTYAIDHLTYSFVVNPKTMKLIQSYNADATVDGGYSDFQMSCNCGNHACVRCASNFITKFVNGTLINGETYKSSDVWGNSKMSLSQVRSSNNYVHWKENE